MIGAAAVRRRARFRECRRSSSAIQNLNIGGRISKSQYQYVMQSGDTESLYRLAPEMRDKIEKVPGLLDVTTDLYIKNPQMTVDIDREKAAVYGVTVDQVRNQLYNAYGARQVGTIYMPSNDYQIILEVQPQFRVDPSDLSKLYMKTQNNQTIPLSMRWRSWCRPSVRCRSTIRASSRR